MGNLFGGNSFSVTGTRFQCFPSPIVQFLGKFQFSGVTGFTVLHINERRNVWSCSSYSMIICEIDYQYRDDFILSILFSIVQVSIFIHHEQSISFVMMGNTVTQRHKKYSHISEHSKSLIYGELCRNSRGISFQLWMNLGLEKDVSLLSCLSYNCKALQKSENKWRQNPLYLLFF